MKPPLISRADLLRILAAAKSPEELDAMAKHLGFERKAEHGTESTEATEGTETKNTKGNP